MERLVTGGREYIGSHSIFEWLNNKHEVIVADNLMNSITGALDKTETITQKCQFFIRRILLI